MHEHNLTRQQIKEIDYICKRIDSKGYTKKVFTFNLRLARKYAKEYNITCFLPKVRLSSQKRSLLGAQEIFKKYIEFAIDESFKYHTDIYIPHIGMIEIREIESVGVKRRYRKDGKLVTRLDTVFDKRVMYGLFFQSFLNLKTGYYSYFRLEHDFMNRLLTRIYNMNLEEGTYPFRKRKKK